MDQGKKYRAFLGFPLRTLLFVILLGLISALLCLLAIKGLQKTNIANVVVNSEGTLAPETTLSISQNPIKVSTPSGSFYESDIIVNTGANKINSSQIELSFDPSVISYIDIRPGPFFQNPYVSLKNIDLSNGRISYAIGVYPGQEGVSGNDIIATLVYYPSDPKIATRTAINFLPKTEVTAKGSLKTVLKKSTGATFTIGPLVFPTPTPMYEKFSTRSASLSAH